MLLPGHGARRHPAMLVHELASLADVHAPAQPRCVGAPRNKPYHHRHGTAGAEVLASSGVSGRRVPGKERRRSKAVVGRGREREQGNGPYLLGSRRRSLGCARMWSRSRRRSGHVTVRQGPAGWQQQRGRTGRQRDDCRCARAVKRAERQFFHRRLRQLQLPVVTVTPSLDPDGTVPTKFS